MEWELKFLEWANQHWTSPPLDQVLPYITHLGGQIGTLFFVLLSGLLIRERKIFYRLFLLYGIESAAVYSLKFLIHRTRPLFLLQSPMNIYRGEILDPSFPSGHAAYAFMMATLLAHWFPRHWILFSLAACFIGWTRIYLNLHYPTDVIAGGLLGYGLTRLFLRHIDLRETPS